MRGKKTESLRCSTFHRASAHTVDSCLFLGAHLAGKNSQNQCRLEKTPGDVMKPHCSSWSVKKTAKLKIFCVKSEQLEMVLCQIRTTWYCFVLEHNNFKTFCVGSQQLDIVLCWITTTYHCFVLDHKNLTLFFVETEQHTLCFLQRDTLQQNVAQSAPTFFVEWQRVSAETNF